MTAEATVDGVLRVLGDLDLDRLFRTCPEIVPDSIWRRGEFQGRPLDCGFNKLLFEDVSPQAVVRELTLALKTYRHVIRQCPIGTAQIDLGVFCVGANCGVVLDGQAVAVVAELGLGLAFAYYPSFD